MTITAPQVIFTAPLIPADFGEKLQGLARKATKAKLQLLLEIRDFAEENYEKIEVTGWQNFYKEVSLWTNYSWHSIDKGLDTIRSYETKKLHYWTDNGLSFDHIENANWAQNQCTMYGDQILDAAIELGNENGKVMTVDEMLTFALGGNIQKPEVYPLVNTLSKWLTKIPLKFPHWEPSKVSRVKELIQQLMEELK